VCLGGVVIVNLVGFQNEVQDTVRSHVEAVQAAATASSGCAGTDISEDKVQGVEDGIDQVDLSSGQGGKDSAGEVKLSSEESSEEGSEELGDDDGGKNSKEEWEELGDLAEVKSRVILLGSSVLITSSIIARGSSITIVRSTVLHGGSSVPSLRSSVTGVCSTVRCLRSSICRIICEGTSDDGSESDEVSNHGDEDSGDVACADLSMLSIGL